MSNQNSFHCIVDDTALTNNLDEIGPWVQAGTVNLVVPLYTLERLHLLKKDASPLGQSARKAVKFLDTTADLPHCPVVIQGPDDQYKRWSEVEKRYVDSVIIRDESGTVIDVETPQSQGNKDHAADDIAASPGKLMNDLSLTPEDIKTSPISTPPLSPTSEPQSTKTSPEVRCATIVKHDATPVPPVLKPLVNFVVWYTYEARSGNDDKSLIFLTNSADAAQIAKDFGVVPKTIHQLRASISIELQQSDQVAPAKSKKNRSTHATSVQEDMDPPTLFRYEEESSGDEELVFQPRTRDLSRPVSSGRGAANNGFRGRGALHSPSNSINAASSPKPQIPVEEIDPDSFDRGTFARGSTPLANVGNHYGPPNNNLNARGQRNFGGSVQRGGGFRGNTFRGRGRGRLFVP